MDLELKTLRKRFDGVHMSTSDYDKLVAEVERLEATIEPVRDWYDGDGRFTDIAKMLTDAIADLQVYCADRAELLKLKAEVEKLKDNRVLDREANRTERDKLKAELEQRVWCPDCGALQLDDENDKLKAENEKQQVQSAGVSVAALGGTKDPAKQGDYGWSVPYQDVLDLRIQYDKYGKALEKARDTFADTEKYFKMVRKDTMAAAMQIARKASDEALKGRV